MTTVTVIIVVLLVAALAAAAFVMLQKQRRAQLQERFGPEYDRAVEGAENRREAEAHLTDVAQRRDKLEVRDLDEVERSRYSTEWDGVQTRFVDEPGQAVDAAEVLIASVMRERGYPVEDFDERADLVAADHPEVVQHYRDAHAAHERHRSAGGVDTEDLRQSFVHYRSLFVVLVDPAAGDANDTGRAHASARAEADRANTDPADRTARAEADRADAEARAEADRVEADRAEADRVEADRAEVDRAEVDHAEADRVEADRVEADRVEADRAEVDHAEADRAAAGARAEAADADETRTLDEDPTPDPDATTHPTHRQETR
jgi:hypothetical protein